MKESIINNISKTLTVLSKTVFNNSGEHFTFSGDAKTKEAIMYNAICKGLRDAGFTVWRCHVSNEIKITA